MLYDQTFSPKPIVAVGPEFFRPDPSDLPDYAFTLTFREQEQLHAVFDFHFVAMDNSHSSSVLEHLWGWGAPVVLGKLFDAARVRDSYKEALSLFTSFEVVHSPLFVNTFRLQGRKNVSANSSEDVLLALISASVRSDPDAFQLELNRLTL